MFSNKKKLCVTKLHVVAMDSRFSLFRPCQHGIANKMAHWFPQKRCKVKQECYIIVGCGCDNKVNDDDSGKMQSKNVH